jgi:hypothetical protein
LLTGRNHGEQRLVVPDLVVDGVHSDNQSYIAFVQLVVLRGANRLPTILWAYHPGGAQFPFGDGSGPPVSEEVSLATLRAMASINQGETTGKY